MHSDWKPVRYERTVGIFLLFVGQMPSIHGTVWFCAVNLDETELDFEERVCGSIYHYPDGEWHFAEDAADALDAYVATINLEHGSAARALVRAFSRGFWGAR